MVLPRFAASPASMPHRRSRRRDGRGHRVTRGDCDAIGALDQFTESVLRRGRGAKAILDAAAAKPDCPMIQACGAAYHLLADTRSDIGRAALMLEQARRLLFAATEREIMFVSALSAIADEKPHRASALFLALAQTAPRDLLAGYIGHLHFLNHGNFDAMLAHARLLHQANPDDPFALGMLAFAREEAGAADAALDAAFEANAIDPSIAWVHHAVAHVLKTQGRLAEGIGWLTERAHYWQACGSSMFTHNWWHTQLLLLDEAAPTQALALYDRLIVAEVTQSVSSFVNASSFLARLAHRGIELGSRWLPLADEARRRIGEHVLPFIDLHYAVSLAYADDVDGCEALKRSVQLHAARQRGEMRAAWQLAGVPLIDAVIACGRGDLRSAHDSFEHGMPNIMLVGGSGQQRGLFRELQAHAASVPARFAMGGRGAPSAREEAMSVPAI
jgi:tetratricopeptide (TPR) repeat protein